MCEHTVGYRRCVCVFLYTLLLKLKYIMIDYCSSVDFSAPHTRLFTYSQNYSFLATSPGKNKKISKEFLTKKYQ